MRAQPAGINPFKNFLEDNVQVTKQFYFLFLKILHLKIQKLKAAVLLTSFF